MSSLNSDPHHENLAKAFDGQAAQFEKAPVQTDPDALRRLVGAADFPLDSLLYDAGCGPGLVSSAFLEAGHRVVGVDLSSEMIERARARCASFGGRARFEQRSIGTEERAATYDGSISRYVLHHVVDPLRFLQDQIKLIRPGGVVVLSDHSTDPRLERASEHEAVERLRDRTHTRNLTPGAIVDLFALAGLERVRSVEEPFTLDFDEWFDRGTPTAPKAEVRERIAKMPPTRGFQAEVQAAGRLAIHCWRAIVRGVVPGPG